MTDWLDWEFLPTALLYPWIQTIIWGLFCLRIRSRSNRRQHQNGGEINKIENRLKKKKKNRSKKRKQSNVQIQTIAIERELMNLLYSKWFPVLDIPEFHKESMFFLWLVLRNQNQLPMRSMKIDGGKKIDKREWKKTTELIERYNGGKEGR